MVIGKIQGSSMGFFVGLACVLGFLLCIYSDPLRSWDVVSDLSA
jgi:hypothetical protein